MNQQQRYAVLLDPRAKKDLEKDVQKSGDRGRVDDAIEGLQDDPRPIASIKLVGKGDFRRLREGYWRILYVVHDEERTILVARVLRRNERTYQ